MLIATWNVNGVRARTTRLLEWLAERKPDVVCLQELKVDDDEFPHEPLRAAGYHAAIVGQRSWNGVGVLARDPPTTQMRQLPGTLDGAARYVAVTACGLTVASAYVPNGKTLAHPEFRTKLDWLERLAVCVEGRADKDAPYVLAGDFNVCPTDQDSYLGANASGTIFHTQEERARVERLFGAGLVDLFRAKNPNEPGFTWWDYRAGSFHKKLGMRLDWILATPRLASSLQEIFVDRDFRKKSKLSDALPSDHAPVLAVIG